MRVTDEGGAGANFLLSEINVGQSFAKLSQMPGRHKWVDRNLRFASVGINVDFLMENFPDTIWVGSAGGFRDEYISLKQQEQNMRVEKAEMVVSEDLSMDGYVYETEPLKHQRRTFLMTRDLKEWGILHEQGTGKSKIITDTVAYLYEQDKIDTAIIVTKNGLHIKWVMIDLPTHLPKRIPLWSEYYSSSHSPQQYKRRMDQAKMTHKKILRVITFNVEGFGSDKAQALMEEWLKHGRCILIVDDGRIGNYAAKKTKYLIDIAPQADYRRVATGTPITRGVENLYSLFKFLNPLILGHGTWTTFKNEYCIEGRFKNITGYRNIEKLIKVTEGWSDRVLKVDCLDLPPKVYRRLPFEMSPYQAQLYEAFRKQFLEEVQRLLDKEGEERATEIAIVRALRLQQIACGWTPEKPMARLKGPNPRLSTLMDEIAENREAGKKSIIWARFSGDLEEIHKLCGKSGVIYVGTTSKDDRVRAIDRFQNHAGCTEFIGHANAAGTGNTLTAGTRTIYHSNLSDLELRLQSEDRNHRYGTTESVTYTDLEAVFPDGRLTIDRRVIDALRSHRELAREILQDPVSLFMEATL